jgi:D-alanyl-D-alanine dipeptidase
MDKEVDMDRSVYRLSILIEVVFGGLRTRFFWWGLLLAGCILPNCLPGQPLYTKPPVIEKMQAYRELIRTDPDQQLIELRLLIPSIVYDLRYATANNFTGQALYPVSLSACYLRRPAALALARVAASLQQRGLGLKIFDAYRPYHVTERFWQLIGDDRYVAHPAKGSGHNRGIAVDLSLIDLRTGKEIDMGTDFDNFTDSAHHTFTKLDEPVLKNRDLLRKEMIQAGFVPLETEWWHYALPNGAGYPLLNISFKKLK